MVDVLVIAILYVLLAAGPPAAMIGLVVLCLWLWQRLMSTVTFPVAGNRILYWPVALAIAWPLLFALLWLLYAVFWLPIISEIFFVIFGGALFTLWVGTVIVAFRLMKQWAAARYWRTVLSTLILPLTFLLVISSSPFLLKENYSAIDEVKFFAQYRSFLADVEKRAANKPRFIVWLWGGADDFGVLYDETDEIASDHPSEAWEKKASDGGVVRSYHRHIIGHFYFVRIDMFRM